ncbi:MULTISPECIES: phage tail sheath subtilisin-like domain-containing protein [unclassified Gilliamella]|uniref:phage tail sheath subtilisin-like domain-containing protein n=1 Tax=unclassified Gilliamella TaxID=2685620 RepID=UPI002269F4CD|nr:MULTISPECIES: phage tail sheath subtilisin-like domain-containing protein [unclassified Gilliamella]MCX8574520.1 phage tail sheath subtilisin-like domain-containing protein [Gilliamella sp. B3831]MCX8576751.1 phage tail sheath subtilisin-like domain-containing protein [Gilliamella sp. B3815]MCX8589267.1 phage tail sheath subtilisin-like domain-containing protein [Gilliamella sp. B3812]MCX8603841.1 phage tail sheath subtilisin-like domain-containing protein [Gilliamella sp. B3823]MCX8606721.
MTISFNNIPSNIKVPLFYAEVDSSAANTIQDSGASLIIAYPLAESLIERNKLIIMPTADHAKKLSGRGSQLSRMVEAYRNIDNFGELFVIAVDEPTAGSNASGTIQISGTAEETGTLSLYIGNSKIQSRVTVSDTAESIANGLHNAINTHLDLPVTATVTNNTITLTAKHKGLSGNDIPLCFNYYGTIGGEATPDGLNIVINQMHGGTGTPDLTPVIAAMGDKLLDFIAFPFNDLSSLATFNHEMDDTTGRWSYARQLYGHAYTAKKGDLSELIEFGDKLNYQHITVAGYEKTIQTGIDELIAMRTARNAVFIRNDPARPTQTGLLNGALPASDSNQFTLTEQQSLLSHGIATAYASSGNLLIQRDITTYQRNSYGVADNSYLDSETLHTLAYVLRKLRSVITSKYPRHKLANDGTRFGAGQAIITPAVAKAEINATYRQLELLGLVENFDVFKKNLIVERNVNDPNRLDVLFPPDLVNQLRVFAVLAQFRLQYKEEKN